MPKPGENLALLEIPKSMWPVDLDLIANLPEIFGLTTDELVGLKYPWELLVLLRQKLSNLITEGQVNQSAEVSDKAYIEGPVWVEEGARILPFAVVIGPSFIGKNTLIGNHTQVRGSFVGNNSMIGAGTEFIRSICLDQCTFHRNYVGDSLLGNGINIGGDSALANVRLDRTEVRSIIDDQSIDTGLKTFGSIIGNSTNIAGKAVVMPGIKIGSNCLVGPGVILFKDLPSNSKIKVLQEQQITQIS